MKTELKIWGALIGAVLKEKPVEKFTVGILCRAGSMWIGFHWSPYRRRLCVNVIPFVTVWFVLRGGMRP
jgi:hypothetical protein